MRDTIRRNPSMMIPHYLMASFLYYEEDAPVISDTLYDEMSREMLARWDDLSHPHKHLIAIEDLRAGTGFAIHYPLSVRHAALAFAKS